MIAFHKKKTVFNRKRGYMMKKIISLSLMVILSVLVIFGCNKKETVEEIVKIDKGDSVYKSDFANIDLGKSFAFSKKSNDAYYFDYINTDGTISKDLSLNIMEDSALVSSNPENITSKMKKNMKDLKAKNISVTTKKINGYKTVIVYGEIEKDKIISKNKQFIIFGQDTVIVVNISGINELYTNVLKEVETALKKVEIS